MFLLISQPIKHFNIFDMSYIFTESIAFWYIISKSIHLLRLTIHLWGLWRCMIRAISGICETSFCMLRLRLWLRVPSLNFDTKTETFKIGTKFWDWGFIYWCQNCDWYWDSHLWYKGHKRWQLLASNYMFQWSDILQQ